MKNSVVMCLSLKFSLEELKSMQGVFHARKTPTNSELKKEQEKNMRIQSMYQTMRIKKKQQRVYKVESIFQSFVMQIFFESSHNCLSLSSNHYKVQKENYSYFLFFIYSTVFLLRRLNPKQTFLITHNSMQLFLFFLFLENFTIKFVENMFTCRMGFKVSTANIRAPRVARNRFFTAENGFN